MLHNYSALIYTGCLNNIYIYIYIYCMSEINRLLSK